VTDKDGGAILVLSSYEARERQALLNEAWLSLFVWRKTALFRSDYRTYIVTEANSGVPDVRYKMRKERW
jgi:hypothetical protein